MNGVVEALPAALRADVRFIVGYGLVLGGFAWIFSVWAFSSSGRLVARFVRVAVGITVVADLAKVVLLYLTLRYTADPAKTSLILATSAAATIKWCALILALGGIAATVGIVARAAATWVKLYVRTRRGRRGNWWKAVLAPPDLPDPQTTDPLTEEEWSWVQAYNVPGAKKIIESRDNKPVQAVCLSGGGVRSACVAMGTMQILSEADPLDPKDLAHDPGKPAPRLIDRVD